MTRRLLAAFLVLLVSLLSQEASAWIENKIEAAHVRLTIDRQGVADVEYRLKLHTNGNERFRRYFIEGVDPSARVAASSYIVPAADALSGALDSAVGLKLQVQASASADNPTGTRLQITVADERGLRRGRYEMVLRYQTNLRERGLLVRDGALVRVRYPGLRFVDGLSTPTATFILSGAPTPPRAVQQLEQVGRADDVSVPGLYLSELRRGGQLDELELSRSYAPAGESVPWIVLTDQRAFEPIVVPRAPAPPVKNPRAIPFVRKPATRGWLVALGALVFVLYAMLVVFKGRSVARISRAHRAVVLPVVRLPLSLRAALSSTALVGGLYLQFVSDDVIPGSALIVFTCLLAAHGDIRPERTGGLRGPGRWLSVSEEEALLQPPRPTGSWLDWSTRGGKALCLFLLLAAGVGAGFAGQVAPWHASLLALDAVVLLALFGTGMEKAMPPDLAVEPARFLREVVFHLRKMPTVKQLRLVPRIRIPRGEVDADELRLLVVPRVPLRGLNGIEVGVMYALGTGARVAMPEVLVRVVSDSPSDEAIALVSRTGRITPGRKADERVVALSPRFPTARMTARIVAAVATRLIDREATPSERPLTPMPPASGEDKAQDEAEEAA